MKEDLAHRVIIQSIKQAILELKQKRSFRRKVECFQDYWEIGVSSGCIISGLEILKSTKLLAKHRIEVVKALIEIEDSCSEMNIDALCIKEFILFISRENKIINFFVLNGGDFSSEEGISLIKNSDINTLNEALSVSEVSEAIEKVVGDNNDVNWNEDLISLLFVQGNFF